MTMLRRVRVVLDFETEILEIREDRIRARHEENRRRWGPEAYPNEYPPRFRDASKRDDLVLELVEELFDSTEIRLAGARVDAVS